MLNIAKARKPYKLIAFALALCFGIVSTLCVAFASPSLSDSTIICSVRGSFLRYVVSTTFTEGCFIDSNGTFVSGNPTSNYYFYTSDYIPLNGGTFFVYRSYNDTYYPFWGYAIYNSDYSVISGSPRTSQSEFVLNRSCAYIRFTVRFSSSASLDAINRTIFGVSTPDDNVNSSNWRMVFSSPAELSLTDDIVTVPYQTYAFNAVMLDFMFYDSNKSYQSVGVDVRSTYSNTSLYDGLVDYSDSDSIAYASIFSLSWVDDVLIPFSEGRLSSSTNNPTRLATYTRYGEFVGFRLYIPIHWQAGSVSTSVDVQLSNFSLDERSVDVELSIYDALNQLNELANQLAVPTPGIDFDNLLGNAFSGTDMSTTNNFFAVFYDNVIVPKMLLIAVTIGLLGYILFGKRDA